MNTSKYLIRFFKVGDNSKSGDAILLELYDDMDKPHLVLIDGGYQETGDKIVAYLTERFGCNPTIDYMINTHPDRDHISGLISLLSSENVKVKNLIINRPWIDANIKKNFFKDRRITANSLLERIKNEFSLLTELEDLALNQGVQICSPLPGKTLYNGVIQILGPSKDLYKKHLLLSDKTPESLLNSDWNKAFVRNTYSEEVYNVSAGPIQWFDDEETSNMNQTSIILSVKLGNLHFLFTGDAGKEAINAALDFYEKQSRSNSTKDFTHLQLPHHGSRKNINPAILNRIQARTYLISCAPEGEKENHPSRRLMNKILELNPDAKIYRTGDVNFVFHKNVEIKANHAVPQRVCFRMDGKAK